MKKGKTGFFTPKAWHDTGHTIKGKKLLKSIAGNYATEKTPTHLEAVKKEDAEKAIGPAN